MRDKVTRQCPQTTTFEETEKPKQIRTEVPLLTSLAPYRQAKLAHTDTVIVQAYIYYELDLLPVCRSRDSVQLRPEGFVGLHV